VKQSKIEPCPALAHAPRYIGEIEWLKDVVIGSHHILFIIILLYFTTQRHKQYFNPANIIQSFL
jgi:hypothetical protein